MKQKKLLCVLLSAVMAASLAACGSSSSSSTATSTADTAAATAESTAAETETADAAETTAEAAEEAAPAESQVGGTLRVALTNSFTGASAIQSANPYWYASLDQVYETLIEKDGDSYDGVLAKSWESQGDGVWEVELYDNITDSEGNPFTANDVAFCLDNLKDYGPTYGAYYEKGAVTVEDDTHFTLTLTTDSEGAFYAVGGGAMLCTQAAYEGDSNNLSTFPIGTGPYECKDYQEGSSLTLVKRDDYWKTEDIPPMSVANYDEIDISFVPESTQMSVAIDGGDIDFAGQVNMSIAADVEASSMTPVYMTNGTFNGLAFNMYNRVVSDNAALREAICYAIDVNGLIAGVYSGHAVEMEGYGMDTASDFDASWTKSIHYDAEMAKTKLAEANVPAGTTITLLSNNVGEDSQMAELVQAYLNAAGITCEIDYTDPATQSAKIAEGNWDICFSGGFCVLDESLFYSNFLSKQDTGRSKYGLGDEEFYKTYDAFAAVGGKTQENLQKIYEYVDGNTIWYPMFNKQVLYAYGEGYSDCFLKDTWQDLPYLGTIVKQ